MLVGTLARQYAIQDIIVRKHMVMVFLLEQAIRNIIVRQHMIMVLLLQVRGKTTEVVLF
jgi:hypothetical protein